MRMSDCETVDDIMTEFAKRDPAGYVVWGQKILRAYREEAKNRENESRAANNLADALNAEVKRLTAEIEKLKFDNMHLKSGQRTAGEVIIEQTNKVEAKDAETEKLRALVGELADAVPYPNLCVGCDVDCKYYEDCKILSRRSLVSRAREVCK